MTPKIRRLPVWYVPMAGGFPSLSALPVTWQGYALALAPAPVIFAAVRWLHSEIAQIAVAAVAFAATFALIILFTDRDHESI